MGGVERGVGGGTESGCFLVGRVLADRGEALPPRAVAAFLEVIVETGFLDFKHRDVDAVVSLRGDDVSGRQFHLFAKCLDDDADVFRDDGRVDEVVDIDREETFLRGVAGKMESDGFQFGQDKPGRFGAALFQSVPLGFEFRHFRVDFGFAAGAAPPFVLRLPDVGVDVRDLGVDPLDAREDFPGVGRKKHRTDPEQLVADALALVLAVFRKPRPFRKFFHLVVQGDEIAAPVRQFAPAGTDFVAEFFHQFRNGFRRLFNSRRRRFENGFRIGLFERVSFFGWERRNQPVFVRKDESRHERRRRERGEKNAKTG